MWNPNFITVIRVWSYAFITDKRVYFKHSYWYSVISLFPISWLLSPNRFVSMYARSSFIADSAVISTWLIAVSRVSFWPGVEPQWANRYIAIGKSRKVSISFVQLVYLYFLWFLVIRFSGSVAIQHAAGPIDWWTNRRWIDHSKVCRRAAAPTRGRVGALNGCGAGATTSNLLFSVSVTLIMGAWCGSVGSVCHCRSTCGGADLSFTPVTSRRRPPFPFPTRSSRFMHKYIYLFVVNFRVVVSIIDTFLKSIRLS